MSVTNHFFLKITHQRRNHVQTYQLMDNNSTKKDSFECCVVTSVSCGVSADTSCSREAGYTSIDVFGNFDISDVAIFIRFRRKRKIETKDRNAKSQNVVF